MSERSYVTRDDKMNVFILVVFVIITVGIIYW